MDHLTLENILSLELLTAIRWKKISKYTWASFPELIKRTFLIRDKDGDFPGSWITDKDHQVHVYITALVT